MAEIVATMQALGTEPPCHGCGTPHQRGSQMTAVEDSEGENLGWFCPSCIDQWKAGSDPRFAEETPDA